jgi:hypothetical protein
MKRDLATGEIIPPSYEEWYRDTYDTAMGGFPPQLIYEEQWGAKRREYLEKKYANTNESRLDLAIAAGQQGVAISQNLLEQRNHLVFTIHSILGFKGTASVASIQSVLQYALERVDEIGKKELRK